MHRFNLVLILTAALSAPVAVADFPEPIQPNQLSDIKAQIENGQAEAALEALDTLLPGAQIDADVLNLMGYANRKLGRFAQSRSHYSRALRLDPNHKGALEYMGELELQTGHPDAARSLLGRLQILCPEGCEERDDLEEAFAESGIPLEGG